MAELVDFALLESFGVHNKQIVCDTGEQLTVQTIARVLPNVRLVCKCLFNANEVYVKIFTGLRASIHVAREAGGIKLLQNAKLLTPNLLLETTTNSQPILVFEAIESEVNAEDFMRNEDYLARKNMAEKLTQTVAQLHNAHLMQTDIHLNNFLISQNSVYTIDGDGIKESHNQSQKQHNLATFLSKFDALDDDFMQDSVEAYFAATNKQFSIEQFVDIYFLTQKIRRETVSDYADKKVFRQCTDVNIATKNTALQGIFYAASSHAKINIPNNMSQLDVFIKPQNLLKNGNTCTVALAEIDSKKIVIKRYNIKSIWHGIGRAFRQTRAAASWANAHRLKLLNIATAAPIALIEQRNFGLFRAKAYFLAEYIEAPSAAEYFVQTRNKANRASAVASIAKQFYKLYLLKISHGDMKASNIKMVDNKPVLIDLDSMRQHNYSYFALSAHVRDLKRFMQNWENEPSLYNAFVKTFRVVYEDFEPLEKAGIFNNKELTE